jgi:DNA polymerase (family 10)
VSDNATIARLLGEIADLLDISGDNPFKVRAYRNAADIVGHAAEQVATMDDATLRTWGGIGKDLAQRIHEIATTGDCAVRRELLETYPITLLDVLSLQGVGPKTVGRLFAELAITSIPELEVAARDGRIRALKGMGQKKETLILQALAERQQHAGRHLLADAASAVQSLLDWLHAQRDGLDLQPVGSLRRGAETCGDVDILAVGADRTVLDLFVSYPKVTRVLAHGETKASVLLDSGLQADMRAVDAEARGAALQYFTGSKAHNIALRDRAIAQGCRLNEYGLVRVADNVRLAGDTEEGLYRALGLPLIPPELREDRGELVAAEAGDLPSLITVGDLRGDVHMHTTESDGRDDLEAMAHAALTRGLSFIAITDHSKALAVANGMDEARTLAHAARIRALNAPGHPLTLLAGIECDILADGRMDLDDECLKALDVVVASVHLHLGQDEATMTARIIRAIEHPWVDIIGHPTNRLLLRRAASHVHIEKVIDAAAANGVALEINAQPDRRDLSETHARLARDRGVKLVINSDAHATAQLGHPAWGVLTARRAWLTPDDVLNTRDVHGFRRALKRHR